MLNSQGLSTKRSVGQQLQQSRFRDVFQSRETAEQYVIRFAFAIYLLFQVNAAFHHGSWGQDLASHKFWISQALANPWSFILVADPGRPEPPLFYLGAAVVLKLAGGAHYLQAIALLSIAINSAGLLVFYYLLRLVVNDWLIRIACFLFITFLPVFMIHALVLATDALCVPIAVVIYYFLIKISRERNSKAMARYIAVISCALLIGAATKYLFVSQGIAVLIALGVYLRTGRLQMKHIAKGSVAIALITLTGIMLILRAHTSIGFDTKAGTEMGPSDILLLHRHDAHILSAPPYNQASDPRDGTPVRFPFELLRQHRYSYAALVHLGIYSDMLNIYQYDPADNYFGVRSRSNEKRMRLAVKTGLLFSFAGLILTVMMVAKAFYGSLIQRKAKHAEWAALAICGLGWFLNIVVFLPKVQAYPGGYWTPRLILPALLCFTVLCAISIDQWMADKPRMWAKVILIIVIFQSLLQLSFLWPSGALQS